MVNETRRRRLPNAVKLTLLTLTPVLLLVVIAETAATLSLSRRARTNVDSATGRSVYTMRVGRWPWSRRSTTPLNSMGFPDAEFPAAQPKGDCVHVVFAGDSYIFGDGVDRDSNFVEIVRRRVGERSTSRCIRMFNLGERGTTIDRQSKRILETFDRLRPDLVIVGQYQNDLLDLTAPGAILGPPPPPPGTPPPARVAVVRDILNANIIKLLTYRSMAVMIRQGIKRDELKYWSVMADSSRREEATRLQAAYAKVFAELADTLAARKVALGVVIIPSKLDVLAKRFPEEAYFVDLANRHRVPHLRIFPILDAQRSPYAFLMYDGHMNEHGNRLVANALYEWLFESAPPAFPALGGGADRR